jgi:hypothetical protein
LCIAVHGGELGVNRTGSADTNKKLFEQKHDRQRQAPPANATTSANATSAGAKFAGIKAAGNATSTRENAGQKVLPKTGQAAQAAPADECLLKAACLYGVGHRRRDDGKKNEIRASEKVEKRVFFITIRSCCLRGKNTYQCSGSMTFWCGSGSADPCL